jgi:hypothetical protein
MPVNFFKKKKAQEEQIVKKEPENPPVEDNSENILNTKPSKIVDIKEKEKEVKKKKRRFFLLLTITIISGLTIMITPSAVKIYKKYFVKPEPIISNPEDNENQEQPEIIDPESIVEYSNDKLKISLEHLRKASLFENLDDSILTKKIEIIYDKNKDDDETTLESLTEGYIFRISSFSTSLRELDEITQVKKEAFSTMCPSTATLSETKETTINGVGGRYFEVKNCDADYKVSYVVKNGLNYEFAQIFKGDLGYRQLYKAETENILRSIEFYPEEIPDPGPTETYNNDDLKISFEYPRSLDSECCNITGPISSNAKTLLTLGDTKTYVDENNLDAIAFFVDQNRIGDFDAYVERQKNLLTDDYIVIMGKSPQQPQIRSIKVGDRDAVMLKGYSWRENDLIFVDITQTGKNNQVLVISIKNFSGEGFEDITESILDSFEFY